MGDYAMEKIVAPFVREPTLCDTDERADAILATEVRRHAELAPDVFGIAVAIRENLPPGLEADDFDGQNIEAHLEV